MTDMSDRYRRLSAAFTDQITAVAPQRWDDPSPCPDWTARQVLSHVVDTQRNVAAYVGRDLSEGPSVTDAPVQAWTTAQQGLQALLDDPSTAQLEFDGMGGRTSLQRTVDTFLCFDLVVHAWDIARATGGDERMDPTEVDRIQRQAEQFGEAMRVPGGFGAAVAAPEGADAQQRLLAYLGRQP